jgi:hypothetical protein
MLSILARLQVNRLPSDRSTPKSRRPGNRNLSRSQLPLKPLMAAAVTSVHPWGDLAASWVTLAKR